MKSDAKDLFARAHELSGEEREAFLSEACGEDAELHLEVQRLVPLLVGALVVALVVVGGGALEIGRQAGLVLGGSAAEALAAITRGRAFIDYRQLLVIDSAGRTAIHSGGQVLGVWGEARATDGAAGGNLLAGELVPMAIVEAFTSSKGHLGERLMQALEAGLAAGGEAGPVHSAGLKVADRLSWPLVDLRIDWADDPIGMLREAWNIYAPQMAAYVQRAEDPTQAPSYGVPGDE